ncbi:hypothetical protein [Ciceribacter thiooxidans]|uniref:MqsR (Motility quorum-sensing regulator) toxin of toxin-antitoxin system n=1 Tax=Ciceribacter thiooxidans TaxID=1969821 RepID=A0ABV7I0B1_9HYPH|nr:hypothetical protein [Ciceribacter thiooxidans]
MASEIEELAACDQSIAARQPVPSLYHRMSYTHSTHKFTRDEFAALMKKLGASEEAVNRQLLKIDAGTLTPTDVTYIIDYEATTSSAAIVHKRSECVIRINRPDDKLIMELVRVDGLSLWQYQARRP